MSVTLSCVEPERRSEAALTDARVSLTWLELDRVLNRAANALNGVIDEARRVAVFAPNSAETVIGYISGIESGAATVPVSHHLTRSEVVHILKDAQASVLLVGPETAEVGIAAAREAGVAMVVGWRCEPQDGLVHWEQWLAAASDAEPPSDLRPRPHRHYTSGTTGVPKAAHTPPAFWPPTDSIAEFAAALLPKRAPSPGLVASPLYHTGPLVQVRNCFMGVSLVVMERFEPEDALALIAQHRIAGATLVPTHFQRMLALPESTRAKYDVSSMQRLAHTGAACPLGVKQAMIDWFGPVLFDAYGGTESGTTHSITSPEWLERPGSVGKAQPPFETVIIGDDDCVLPAGKEGRVYIRDTTGRGIIYEGDPDKTAAAHIAPGVFTLGEVGYIDAEGYLFITDRVSDMIVSGGVNIYPAEAEQVLLRHAEVADVAVIGAPNADLGEEARALVIPRDPAAPPTSAELDAHCRTALAGFKCPKGYEFVEDIGRTAMGKVNKRTLRERFWPTGRTIGG